MRKDNGCQEPRRRREKVPRKGELVNISRPRVIKGIAFYPKKSGLETVWGGREREAGKNTEEKDKGVWE